MSYLKPALIALVVALIVFVAAPHIKFMRTLATPKV